jgi:hypothetical protein
MDDVTRRNVLKSAAGGVATAGVGAAAAAEQEGTAAGADHLARIESRIKEIDRVMSDLADDKVTREMLQIIHRPGWTTPAEALFVMAALDSIQAQATALAAHRQALLKGCRAVAAS